CFGVELASAEYFESINKKSAVELLRLRAHKYFLASMFYFMSSGLSLEKSKIAAVEYAKEGRIAFLVKIESGIALGYELDIVFKEQVECYKNWGEVAAAAAEVVREESFR